MTGCALPACQALALAIGSVRDRAGYTPPEAVDALVDALKYADNSGNAFDDSHMRAAHLAALGHVRVQSQEVRLIGVQAVQCSK